MAKVKDTATAAGHGQAQPQPHKQAIQWDGDSDDAADSLNESEDDEEEEEEKSQEAVAQYQRHVYHNEQPMMKLDKVQVQVQTTDRRAVDWDEDDFDEVLRPPPGPAQPVDPELSLLLAALDALAEAKA